MVFTGRAVSEGRASSGAEGSLAAHVAPDFRQKFLRRPHEDSRTDFMLRHSPLPGVITMSVCLKSSLTGMRGPHYCIKTMR